MTQTQNDNALSLINRIVAHAIDGEGPLQSAVALADDYRRDRGYRNDTAQINAMIRWETSKSAAVGLATGLPGGPVGLVAIPAGVYGTFVIQARLAAAIAHLRGYSLRDERVRTFILICLLGDGAAEVLREVGVNVVTRLTVAMLERLPGRVLIDINKAVGFKLLTKAGKLGAINLVDWVPVVGGVFGGVFDGVSTAAVGTSAKLVFTR